MKRLLYIIVLLAVSLSATGCMKDFLTPKPKSSMEAKDIFVDPALANGAIMGIYQYMTFRAWESRLWCWTGYNNDVEIDMGTDTTYVRLDEARSYAMYNLRNTDAFYSDNYSGAFICLERANLCIEGLERFADLNDPVFAYFLGEALFLRAWMYYELTTLYGPLPARFEPLSENAIYVGRSDRDVIFKRLLDDLARAADLMPWATAGDQYTSTTLRPSKAAAKALRARIALTAGGKGPHLYDGYWQPNTFSADPELSVENTYEIARKECADLIEHEGKGYTLASSFERIFRDNMEVNHNVGGEPLWKLPFSYNNRGNNMVSWGLVHTGESPSSIQNDPYATTYQGGTVGVSPTLWYDFDGNDKRRDVTVVPMRWYDGRQVLTRINAMSPGKMRAEWKSPAMPPFTLNSSDGITPIILRYADVLLMFAEAENELNGPTVDAQNALKRVRERGFNSDQSAYVTSVSGSKTDFLKAVQNERKWELTGERIRKADLIRWGLLKTNMDIAKENMRKLRDLAPPYDDVPRYVFWRYKIENGVESKSEIEWYGFNRGEVAPGTAAPQSVATYTAWMTAGRWKFYNPNVNLTNYNSLTAFVSVGYLTDRYVNGLYVNNPDYYQVMPIPNNIIRDSQGALSNDFLPYN